MARGQQKIQSQQKNAEKLKKMKKAQGHDQKKAANAALVYSCVVCKVCCQYQKYTWGESLANSYCSTGLFCLIAVFEIPFP